MGLPGLNLIIGTQPVQIQQANPNATEGSSTLIQNNDLANSIDLCPFSNFNASNTYTLDADQSCNWPQGENVYCRVTPNQVGNPTGVEIWVQQGGLAAPPSSVNVKGGTLNANEIQGTPVSATAPTGTNNSFVFDPGTGLWIPGPVNAVQLQGTDVSATGPVDGDTWQVVGGIWTPIPASGAQFQYVANQQAPFTLSGPTGNSIVIFGGSIRINTNNYLTLELTTDDDEGAVSVYMSTVNPAGGILLANGSNTFYQGTYTFYNILPMTIRTKSNTPTLTVTSSANPGQLYVTAWVQTVETGT